MYEKERSLRTCLNQGGKDENTTLLPIPVQVQIQTNVCYYYYYVG